MRNRFVVCILSLILTNCVSVQLSSGKITPAKGVNFNEPLAPFKEMKTINADKAWINEKSGNTISFLSECGNSNEPTLQQLENESLSSLSKLERLHEEEITYNGRSAILSKNKGELDGVPIQISLLVFKKNGCSYTISFGGVASKASQDEKNFQYFKENFKAP